MKAVLVNIKDGILKVWNNKFFSIIAVRYTLLAVVLYLFIESLCRLSFFKAVQFMVTRPHIFLINLMEILAIVSLATFFKKRVFSTFIFALPWGILGIINGILMKLRHTPLTAPDFLDVKECMLILPNYMNPFQIGLVVALIVAVLAGIVVLAIKSPKLNHKINYFKCIAFSAVCISLAFATNNLGQMTGLLQTNFGNIQRAYYDNGFAYCFTCSVFGFGVDRPADYSGDVVSDLVSDISGEGETETETGEQPSASAPNDSKEPSTEEQPNIIFVQLESLFDPTHIKGVTFSEDPLPNLHKLYKNYSSGYLSVPSYGGGTANTEFEVISGMNMDHFGPGEYPYKTVLANKTCETVAYYLKDAGYTTFALHNNEGDFYSRNEVFANLGFDCFTSIEYISDYQTTISGWAKDACLTNEILGMLDSTDTKDFIYTISVQGHGEYPTDIDLSDYSITATDDENVTGNLNGLIYYANQIHDMDAFVGDLINALEARDEKSIVVFYGDHLPSFDLSEDELTNGDMYQTQYVIWSNMDLKKQDRDIESYQLSTVVLNQANISGNLIYRLHAVHLFDNAYNDEEYLEKLQLLEYDILYGECEAYNGVFPYAKTTMQMGYRDIKITDAKNVYSHISIRGKHFTSWSRVYINGNLCKTIYNGSNELIVDDMQLNEGDEVVIKQICVSGLYIGTDTEAFIYTEQ